MDDIIQLALDIGIDILKDFLKEEVKRTFEHYMKFSKASKLAENNQHYAAIALYDEIIKENPRDAISMHNKAISLKELNNLIEAEKVLREAVRIYPYLDRSWGELGKIYYYCIGSPGSYGLERRCFVCFSIANMLDPDNTEYMIGKGSILIKVGEYAAALAWYKQVSYLEPYNEKAKAGIKHINSKGYY